MASSSVFMPLSTTSAAHLFKRASIFFITDWYCASAARLLVVQLTWVILEIKKLILRTPCFNTPLGQQNAWVQIMNQFVLSTDNRPDGIRLIDESRFNAGQQITVDKLFLGKFHFGERKPGLKT